MHDQEELYCKLTFEYSGVTASFHGTISVRPHYEWETLYLFRTSDIISMKIVFNLKNELAPPESFVHSEEKMTSFCTYFIHRTTA